MMSQQYKESARKKNQINNEIHCLISFFPKVEPKMFFVQEIRKCRKKKHTRCEIIGEIDEIDEQYTKSYFDFNQ
jgi:hypothetical protein